MFGSNIRNWLKDFSWDNPWKWIRFNIELWHSPVWLSHLWHVHYWALRNWIRVIEEWIVESVIQWLYIWRELRKEYNRKVHLIVSLSDLHWVTHEERLKIKDLIKSTEYPLIDILCRYWVDENIIWDFEQWIKLWDVVLQSEWTSKISSKIHKLKDDFKKKWAERFFEEHWFLLFEVKLWEYRGLILFSSECFNWNDILKQWIPLLFWEQNESQSTQCWPTVAWIQQQVLWNNHLNRIITVDNFKDTTIRQKSLRGQLLLKLFYWKHSSFITPNIDWVNEYIWPVQNITRLNYQELIKLSVISMKSSGYDEAKILWKQELLIDWKNKTEWICDLWICHLN